MNQFNELLLALFLSSCLMLAVSSRMLHCIRIVAMQGIMLGILPLTLATEIHSGNIFISLLNIFIKGICLPLLMYRAMKLTKVKRELEPFAGYSLSAITVLAAILFSFLICGHLSAPERASDLSVFAIPTAFSTVLTGLFIVISRRKALTQVAGFLVFENGITLFGAAVMREHPLIVELGIMLDIFTLVFIMGITVYQISREFSHIDTDRLNLLGDTHGKEEETHQ